MPNLDEKESREFLEKVVHHDKRKVVNANFKDLYRLTRGCPLEMQRFANKINTTPLLGTKIYNLILQD